MIWNVSGNHVPSPKELEKLPFGVDAGMFEFLGLSARTSLFLFVVLQLLFHLFIEQGLHVQLKDRNMVSESFISKIYEGMYLGRLAAA